MRLNKFQRPTLLCMSSASQCVSIESLIIILNIVPIKEFLLSRTIKFYYRMTHSPNDQTIIKPYILTNAFNIGYLGFLSYYISCS